MVGQQLSISKKAYSIEKATVLDISDILVLGKEFTEEAGIQELYNEAHIRKIFETYIPDVDGVCICMKYEGKTVGFIGGIMQQHMFNPEVVVLVEVMWFVTEEHRKSIASVRLLKEFEKMGIELGASSVYMTLRSDLNMDGVGRLYTALGYTEQERTFQKEV